MRTIAEWEPWLEPLGRASVRDIWVDPAGAELGAVLDEHPRLLLVLNHGPTLGPIPAMTSLARLFLDAGGADRRVVGIAWRGFYRLPVARRLTGLVSGAERVLGVRDLVGMLRSGEATDVAVMPEGDNCNFGDGSEVQPFVSPRFVEIAVRAGVPMLLVAHQGSERWTHPIQVGEAGRRALFGWLPTRSWSHLERVGQVNLTNPFRGRVETMRFYFEVFHPSVDARAIPEDERAPVEMLAEDADRVHAILSRAVARMRAEAGAPTAT